MIGCGKEKKKKKKWSKKRDLRENVRQQIDCLGKLLSCVKHCN